MNERASTASGAVGAMIVVFVLVGIALRFSRLDCQDVWRDEAKSVYLYPSPDLFAALIPHDFHPPLYPLLLRAWMKLGTGIGWMRSLSAVIGSLGLIVMVRVAARHFGAVCALATAAIAGTSSILVYYSQEIRDYALMMLFAAMAFGGLLDLAKAESPRRWDWYAYGLASVALLYSHYYGVLFVGSCFVGGILHPRLRALWRSWIRIHVAVAASLVPLLPAIRYAGGELGGLDMIGGVLSLPRDLMTPYVVFTVGRSLIPFRGSPLFLFEAPAFALGAIGGLALGASGAWAWRRRGLLGIGASLLLLPVLALVMATRAGLAQYNYTCFRFCLFLAPVLLFLYASGIADLAGGGRRRLAIVLGACLVVANLVSVANYLFNPEYWRAPAYREAAAFLAEHRRAGEPVVYSMQTSWSGLMFWMELPGDPRGRYRIDGVCELDPAILIHDPAQLLLAPGGTFWFVRYEDWRLRPRGLGKNRPPAIWDSPALPVLEERRFRGLLLQRRRMGA